jgi:hypothetical protein
MRFCSGSGGRANGIWAALLPDISEKVVPLAKASANGLAYFKYQYPYLAACVII